MRDSLHDRPVPPLRRLLLLSAGAVLTTVGAGCAPSTTLAQPGSGQQRPNPQSPLPPAPPERIEPEPRPPRSGAGTPEEGVPRRGVIRPPEGLDPGIQAPVPPDPGTMQVIPPPGTPGGDPRVEPR